MSRYPAWAPPFRARRQLGKAQPRTLVGAMALSAAGLVGIVMYEGYTDRAVIPVQGDVPTLGFGSTVHEDGSRVKMGDTVTPQRALRKAQAHISRDERVFRDSLPGVALTQGEYDLYIDFVYQYGTGAWHKPQSPRTWLLQGDYLGACNALLNWRFVGKFDCSTPGNRRCPGVWTRQQARHATCLAEGGFSP